MNWVGAEPETVPAWDIMAFDILVTDSGEKEVADTVYTSPDLIKITFLDGDQAFASPNELVKRAMISYG